MAMTMRCLRRSNRRRCPLIGGEVAAFCSSLVEGLVRLESSLCADDGGGGGGGGGGAVSMRWCADALRLVKRMQRELLAVFKKADVPVTVDSYGGAGGAGGGGGGGGWFEHYMQETAALLDFCNALKSAVSRLHRYCMVVDFAAQTGGAAGGGDTAAVSLVAESGAATGVWPGETTTEALSAVHDNLSNAKAVVSETEHLGRKVLSGACGDGGGEGEGGMVVVTLVAKITMAAVSMFLLQALASPLPLPPSDVPRRSTLGRGTAVVPVPELRPWCETLSVIKDRFPRPATVAEHDKVSMAVRDMINATKINMGAEKEKTINGQEQEEMVELLKTRSGELREGVEMFDCVLDEVFDEVIKGRNEMLGIFKDKVLT